MSSKPTWLPAPHLAPGTLDLLFPGFPAQILALCGPSASWPMRVSFLGVPAHGLGSLGPEWVLGECVGRKE